MTDLLPYFTIIIVASCFVVLFVTNKEPELIFGIGLLVLMLSSAVSINGALSGFSNAGFITVGCLYVIAGGIRETSALKPILNSLLNKVNDQRVGQLKILIPVAGLSSFLNNTPIVAALIPNIVSLCKKKKWNLSAFLLPCSYAAILGGTCTLIGTSTNLLIYGFLLESGKASELGFFEIGLIGVPITILGIIYLYFFSGKILSERQPLRQHLAKTREYTVEMIVSESSSLIGKSIEEAELRHLNGLYLIEIIRGRLVMAAIGPKTILSAGDRLVFTGLIDSLGELIDIEGLELAESQVFKLSGNTGQARLVEAVIGPHHPLLGITIKEGQFRKRYNAAIIAVVRDGERIKDKIGNIKLKPGDMLLMLARRSFVEMYSYSKDFLLVNGLDNLSLDKNNKAPFAWGSLSILVVFSMTGILSVVEAALLSASLMVLSGCLSVEQAKKCLDLQVMMTIAMAFGIGTALTESGGAKILADSILFVSGNHPVALLVAIYILTVILTELVTNNAAAVISFSLVSGIVVALGYNIIPFAIAIMIAASASFVSPLGYQTNLMVFSVGGYRFTDYIKLGLPLSIIVGAFTLTVIPLLWPLVAK